jgi:cobalt transporter subunit CbtB
LDAARSNDAKMQLRHHENHGIYRGFKGWENKKMNSPTTQVVSTRQTRSTVIATAAFAMLFGIFLVYGAGFANSQIVHNAVHDARHAFSFPCH